MEGSTGVNKAGFVLPARYGSALRATVAVSAGPYGYALTIWTSGAVLCCRLAARWIPRDRPVSRCFCVTACSRPRDAWRQRAAPSNRRLARRQEEALETSCVLDIEDHRDFVARLEHKPTVRHDCSAVAYHLLNPGALADRQPTDGLPRDP